MECIACCNKPCICLDTLLNILAFELHSKFFNKFLSLDEVKSRITIEEKVLYIDVSQSGKYRLFNYLKSHNSFLNNILDFTTKFHQPFWNLYVATVFIFTQGDS